jgi:hypothetical protein
MLGAAAEIARRSSRRAPLEGVEEEIREKAIEFDHDAGREGEPDGGKDGSGGQKLFHGV